MNFSKSGILYVLLFLGIITLTGWAFTKKEAPPPVTQLKTGTTLDNLMAAYNGESNAQVKYLAYAQKADNERYTGVGSLFRASAAAEAVHLKNHADVIKKMGGTPSAEIKTPLVKSTRENLEEAIKGESYEKEIMYPEFIKKAREDKRMDAVRTFNFSLQVETKHADNFNEALTSLSQWKNGKKDFFVCPVCGYTVAKMEFKHCPICYTAKVKFKKVN